MPIIGEPSGAVWAWPGAALTASVTTLHAGLGEYSLVAACWVLAWDPATAGSSPTGVRLIHADDGPSNITEIARIDATYATTPRRSSVDILDALRGVLSSGATHKHIGHQTFGNGQNGPRIYLSEIQCVWSTV